MQSLSHHCMTKIMGMLPDAASYCAVRLVCREWRDRWSRWAHPPTAMMAALRCDPPDIAHANVLWDQMVERGRVVEVLHNTPQLFRVIRERAPAMCERRQFRGAVMSALYDDGVILLRQLRMFAACKANSTLLCADMFALRARSLQQWALYGPSWKDSAPDSHLLLMQRLFDIVARHFDFSMPKFRNEFHDEQSHVLKLIQDVSCVILDQEYDSRLWVDAFCMYKGFVYTYRAETDDDRLRLDSFISFVNQFDWKRYKSVREVYTGMEEPLNDIAEYMQSGPHEYDENYDDKFDAPRIFEIRVVGMLTLLYAVCTIYQAKIQSFYDS